MRQQLQDRNHGSYTLLRKLDKQDRREQYELSTSRGTQLRTPVAFGMGARRYDVGTSLLNICSE